MKLGNHNVVKLDRKLVAGGYGINIGNIFCGESMFSKKTDASKVALYYLVKRLKKNGFKLMDCQVPSKHFSNSNPKIKLHNISFHIYILFGLASNKYIFQHFIKAFKIKHCC